MVRSSDVRTNVDRLEQLFEENEVYSPYIFLALQILQILFAPIPGQLVGFAGGYFFGFWHGLLLTIIGLGIGSWIAMVAGRLLGKHFVQRFVPQKVITRFDYLTDQGGLGNFFILFLLPAIPDDALCFIAGLTRLSIGKLMLVCIIGRMPGMMVLLSAGASVDENRLFTTILLVIFTVTSLIVWLYKKETENFLYRLVKRDASKEY